MSSFSLIVNLLYADPNAPKQYTAKYAKRPASGISETLETDIICMHNEPPGMHNAQRQIAGVSQHEQSENFQSWLIFNIKVSKL